MNSNEAATVIAVMHGAYPNVRLDDAVAEVWANSLLATDFDIARRAVNEWVSTMTRWPTVAELNGIMRRLRAGIDEFDALPPAREPLLTWHEARDAIERGYRSERRRLGATDDDIDRGVERLFTANAPRIGTSYR
jgi:hypothetical protein